jgi:hypothetical protein
MRVLISSRGYVIGTSDGYLLYYEFQKDNIENQALLATKIHVSNKIKVILSMSMSRGSINDDF